MTAPVATYRLQLRQGMNFDRAAALVPYLKRLGVSHLYASPVFTAVSGSSHGYDVTDCNEIDPVLGGREGLELLSRALHKAGLGLILDIVPNHMAASLENAWWRSVVEWGEQSAFARYFDMDWSVELTLPVLGRTFAECAEAGEIALGLDRERGCAALRYFDNAFPLHPASYEEIFAGFDSPLGEALARRAAEASPENEDAFHDEVRQILGAGDAAALQAEMNQRSRDPKFLAWVHDEQPYRLMFWKEARRHLSYRRFFEVTGLAGLRVEDETVFEATHSLVLDLVAAGVVDGVRVDHIDGLADPGAYLRRLRRAVGPQIPILVEKILEPGEKLPKSWPIEGTTGYEFIAALAGLLTDPGGVARFDVAWSVLAPDHADLAGERVRAKVEMLKRNFEGELSRLVQLCGKLLPQADEDRIKAALVALITAFPVYRSYGDAEGMSEADAALVNEVAGSAARENPSADARLIASIADMLKGQGDSAACAGEFRLRFQQLTGPIMAKAIEDTLFYRYNRLIALNEVGGDANVPRDGLDAFHHFMAERAKDQPFGLSATATHDTKRGEDARARLYALSEYADEWNGAVGRWREMNAASARSLSDGRAPEPETEWLIYQALGGVWPEELRPGDAKGLRRLEERFISYLEKALREAKHRTNWTAVNEHYERAVLDYARALFAPGNGSFQEDFVAQLAPVIHAGHLLSLSQTLIKMAAPGIPDIYQGSEGRDLSLVDPDNRRLPNFESLERQLERGREMDLAHPYACKQGFIARCLAERASMPMLFAAGAYIPVETAGAHADKLVAFLRRDGEDHALALAPRRARFLLDRAGGYNADAWEDTAVILPPSLSMAWRNIAGGGTLRFQACVPVATLLAELPAALFVNSGRPRERAQFARQAWSANPAPRNAAGRLQEEMAMDDERRKQIERRAYELWEEEGKPAGREQAHWEQAAQELDEAGNRDPGEAYPSQREGKAFLTSADAPAKKRRAPAKPRAKKQ